MMTLILRDLGTWVRLKLLAEILEYTYNKLTFSLGNMIWINDSNITNYKIQYISALIIIFKKSDKRRNKLISIGMEYIL